MQVISMCHSPRSSFVIAFFAACLKSKEREDISASSAGLRFTYYNISGLLLYTSCASSKPKTTNSVFNFVSLKNIKPSLSSSFSDIVRKMTIIVFSHSRSVAHSSLEIGFYCIYIARLPSITKKKMAVFYMSSIVKIFFFFFFVYFFF